MTPTNVFSQETIQNVKTTPSTAILQPVHVGNTHLENELVFFIKPELFDVEDNSKILNSLKMIEQKFTEHSIHINGAAIIPGGVLEDYEIMNKHYGFINQLSRKASEMVDQETRDKMFHMLDIKNTKGYRILGGHEFLQAFDAEINTLSDLWFKNKSEKLRSGFYFCEISYQEERIILINGFHPSQLQHFTRKDHRILVMLLHTNTDWMEMKFDVVGDTFPENAKPDSIRGLLYTNPEHFGQDNVGINTNGVHLSAGPFEAAFEITNFFGPLIQLDPATTPPLAIKKAIQAGIADETALTLLDNPTINDSDVFSETENLNTTAAVKHIKDQLIN